MKKVNEYYLLLNQGLSNSVDSNKEKSKKTKRQVLNMWKDQAKERVSKEYHVPVQKFFKYSLVRSSLILLGVRSR